MVVVAKRRTSFAAVFSLFALAPTSVEAGAGSAPTMSAEGWNNDAGWLPLAGAPSAQPEEAWRIDLDGRALFVVRPGSVLTAEAENGSTTVRRIDVATGVEQWRSALDGDSLVSLNADSAGSTALVAIEASPGSTVTTLLDVADGQAIWEQTGEQTPASLQRHQSLAIIGFNTESVAIDVEAAAERWRVATRFITAYQASLLFHRQATDDAGEETFGLLDAATGAPDWERARSPGAIATVLSDVVILSHDEKGSDDSLVGHDVTTGEPMWSAEAPLIGSSGAWPLDPDGALFGGNSDPELPGSLVSIDTASGSEVWNRQYHKPGGLAMWRSGERQVLLTRGADDTLEVVDAHSGTTAVSSTTAPDGWPVFASGALYFSSDEEVTAIDMATLRRLWSVPNATGSRVVGAVDGGFVTVDESGTALAAFIG